MSGIARNYSQLGFSFNIPGNEFPERVPGGYAIPGKRVAVAGFVLVSVFREMNFPADFGTYLDVFFIDY